MARKAGKRIKGGSVWVLCVVGLPLLQYTTGKCRNP
jgi:hypothetical protein